MKNTSKKSALDGDAPVVADNLTESSETVNSPKESSDSEPSVVLPGIGTLPQGAVACLRSVIRARMRETFLQKANEISIHEMIAKLPEICDVATENIINDLKVESPNPRETAL